MFTLTYGFGVALAAFAGVMAAPIYQVTPLMGSSLIIVVFAVVVIGGMGSIAGSIVTGLGVGLVEGLTKFLYPEASSVVVFVRDGDRAARPAGGALREAEVSRAWMRQTVVGRGRRCFAVGIAAPFVVYPVFAMNVLCLALFASAFNLLLGYTGLLSFGHAAFLGSAAYVTGSGGEDLGARRPSSASSPASRSPRSSGSSSAASPSGAPASTSR